MLTAPASGWIWTRSTSDSRCAEVGTGPVRSVDRTVRAARPPHMFTSTCTHSYALPCTQLSPAHTQALCLLTLPELLPQWTHCAGDWCQGTQGLFRTKSEGIGLSLTPRIYPALGDGEGPEGREASLTRRASTGSFVCRRGERLLFKEELTQWAQQLVHTVQLLFLIPLGRSRWPEGPYGLRELL